eukprot:305655-Prorocentrum_minimum.AAC.1
MSRLDPRISQGGVLAFIGVYWGLLGFGWSGWGLTFRLSRRFTSQVVEVEVEEAVEESLSPPPPPPSPPPLSPLSPPPSPAQLVLPPSVKSYAPKDHQLTPELVKVRPNPKSPNPKSPNSKSPNSESPNP